MAVERSSRYAQPFPSYDGNAARQLERVDDRKTNVQRRRHPSNQTNLRTREPGKLSMFGAIGFLVVVAFVLLMLASYANLVAVNDTAVGLKQDLETLKVEESKLLAKYELAYDLQSIEQEVISNGTMVKPSVSQIYMLELTEPDGVEYYQKSDLWNSVITACNQVLSAIQTYF
ncbi:MAG: hypothetical protein RR053_04400 [Evtepia sp.]